MGLPERFRLAVLPTPLVRASRLERALGRDQVWIKRDDLSGFAVAGNKARPLEFLVGSALTLGADTFIATGAPTSNFCAAAAIAARVAGLDCEILYAGAEPTATPLPVLLARAAGAHTRFAPSIARQDLDTAVQAHADELRTAGRRPYAVPRGGATPTGALGFALAAREIAEQCHDAGLDRAVVVVPAGSGATQAGLVAATVGYDLPLRIVGASVSRPIRLAHAGILALARACARELDVAEPGAEDVDVRDAIGNGFGVAGPTDRCSAELALTTEGLLLDDTYMAKTMTLFRQLASGEPSPVVFWHTGGIAAALAALIRDPGASSTGPTSTLPHTQPTPVVHESPTPTERVHE